MSKRTRWVMDVCEYLGGAKDAPPPGFPVAPQSWLWGLWWGLLVCLIIAFCDQTSKFIYIDF